MNQQMRWQQHGYPTPPPKNRGGNRWVVLGIAAVVILVISVGIGVAADSSKPQVSAAPSVTLKNTKTVTPVVIPKPDGEQTEDLLYGLREIDNELDRARSVDRARNTCFDILQGKDKSTVIKNTRLRFDGVAQIDNDDARAIVKLIEQGGWCK